MKYLKTFENYDEELVLEKLNLQPLLDKFKNTLNKKTIAILIVSSLLSVLNVAQATNFIENNLDLKKSEKITLINTIKKYHDPLTLKLSQEGWDHIRKIEKLKLTAYSIGDGMVTIGYGHAEPILTSKYKVGDKISQKTAYNLLIVDVNIAAKGVKRMFEQWQEQGINIKITQNQYDVLISMSYNMGLTSFRTSKFVKMLKHNRLKKAAELIKTTGIDDNFSGLEIRRLAEYQKFIS